MNGVRIVTGAKVVEEILKDKNVKKGDLAEQVNTTIQNLSNKLKRDNFSTLELVEIAEVLGMELVLRDKDGNNAYIIDYPDEQKFQPKRTKKSKPTRQKS